MGLGTRIVSALGDVVSGFGTGLKTAADGNQPLVAKSNVAPVISPNPIQPDIAEKEARPNWDPTFGGFFSLPGGKVDKQQPGKIPITPITLYTLAHTDPVTMAINQAFKTKIRQMPWLVEPFVDKEKSELMLWEKQATLQTSTWADPSFAALLDNNFIDDRIAQPIRVALGKVKPGDPDARRKIRWIIDKAESDINAALVPLCHSTEEFFKHCNNDYVMPWEGMWTQVLDDLLTYDAPAIGCVYKNGNADSLYWLPGDEVRVFKDPDWSTPVPPRRAYSWEVGGRDIAEFTTEDLLYFPRNPQKNGYGFSWVEVAAHMITATLYADSFNMDAFKSDIPPMIVDLGKISPAQRAQFQVFWKNEVMNRDGGRRKVAFTNYGKGTLEKIDMATRTQDDMQFMEYLEWSLLIKCMCAGISPQEIGFTKFLKYDTTTTQEKISNRGVNDMAHFLEGTIKNGIIERFLGIKNLRYKLKREETMMDDSAVKNGVARVNAGLATPNEVRAEWGQRPLADGGDVAAIIMRTGIVPVSTISADAPPGPEGDAADVSHLGQEASADVLNQPSSIQAANGTITPVAGQPVPPAAQPTRPGVQPVKVGKTPGTITTDGVTPKASPAAAPAPKPANPAVIKKAMEEVVEELGAAMTEKLQKAVHTARSQAVADRRVTRNKALVGFTSSIRSAVTKATDKAKKAGEEIVGKD